MFGKELYEINIMGKLIIFIIGILILITLKTIYAEL